MRLCNLPLPSAGEALKFNVNLQFDDVLTSAVAFGTLYHATNLSSGGRDTGSGGAAIFPDLAYNRGSAPVPPIE